MRVITKVTSVYPVDLQKHDQRQTKDGDKKKTGKQFKDVLAKALMGFIEKTTGYRG